MGALSVLGGCGGEGAEGQQGPAGEPGEPGEKGEHGEKGEPGDGADRSIAWATFSGETDSDTGLVTDRRLVMPKASDDTTLRVSYFDSFAAKNTAGACACTWTLQFNGSECDDPGTIQGIVEQTVVSQTILGHCSATPAGPIEKGDVTITVFVSEQDDCDCRTGILGINGTLEAEEI